MNESKDTGPNTDFYERGEDKKFVSNSCLYLHIYILLSSCGHITNSTATISVLVRGIILTQRQIQYQK